MKSVDAPRQSDEDEVAKAKADAESARAFWTEVLSTPRGMVQAKSLMKIAFGLSARGKNVDGTIQTFEQVTFNEGRRSIVLEILQNANLLP